MNDQEKLVKDIATFGLFTNTLMIWLGLATHERPWLTWLSVACLIWCLGIVIPRRD